MCVSEWALGSSGWGESFLEGACLIDAVGRCMSDLTSGVSDGHFCKAASDAVCDGPDPALATVTLD